jgi:hypothetical protein
MWMIIIKIIMKLLLFVHEKNWGLPTEWIECFDWLMNSLKGIMNFIVSYMYVCMEWKWWCILSPYDRSCFELKAFFPKPGL